MDKFTKKLKGYLPVTSTDDANDNDIELGNLNNDTNDQASEPSLVGGCFDLTKTQRITGFAMSAASGGLFFIMVCIY